MYDEDRMFSRHGNVERILQICTPKKYRDSRSMGGLKKRLRKLASYGYLIRKRGRFEAFSLSQRGVILAERWKEGWTVEEINEAERAEGHL
ncbi:MAG: hypothetical protein RTU92_01370 [Candidatus Thorarchaeota archaeon]